MLMSVRRRLRQMLRQPSVRSVRIRRTSSLRPGLSREARTPARARPASMVSDGVTAALSTAAGVERERERAGKPHAHHVVASQRGDVDRADAVEQRRREHEPGGEAEQPLQQRLEGRPGRGCAAARAERRHHAELAGALEGGHGHGVEHAERDDEEDDEVDGVLFLRLASIVAFSSGSISLQERASSVFRSSAARSATRAGGGPPARPGAARRSGARRRQAEEVLRVGQVQEDRAGADLEAAGVGEADHRVAIVGDRAVGRLADEDELAAGREPQLLGELGPDHRLVRRRRARPRPFSIVSSRPALACRAGCR